MTERAEQFFAFAREREQVRLQKEAGQPKPWTDDEILRSYKFTNVCREHDATSRQLISNLYQKHADDDPRSILLNCAVARYFGRWEFALAHGWLDFDTYDPDELEDIARDRRAHKEPVFTGAYVITNSGIAAPKEEVVVQYFIAALYEAIPHIVSVAQKTRSWQEVSKELRKVDGFGGSGFMTKETLVDTTYTRFWVAENKVGSPAPVQGRPAILSIPSDWNDWTPVGPGARRGAARVLGHDDVDTVEARSIRKDEQRCNLVISALMGVSTEALGFQLCPHDVQFVLCEFDKYERVRLGQGRPRSKYNGG